MPKVMMTWASGNEFCRSAGFQLYMKTAKTLSDYDRVVFTHDMSSETEKMVKSEGFEVIHCDEVYFMMRDRHLYFYHFLKRSRGSYNFAIISDSRDVLFQYDPEFILYDHVDYMKDYDAYLVSEGFTHKSSGFNSIEQFEFQRNVAEHKVNMSDRIVLNGGTMFGNPDLLGQLCLNIWLLGIKTIGRCTDQAALNYLWNVIEIDPSYKVLENPEICLTGEGVKVLKELGRPLNVEFRDGKILSDGKPCCVVHQWDRLPFGQKILEHYGIFDIIADSKEGTDA